MADDNNNESILGLKTYDIQVILGDEETKTLSFGKLFIKSLIEEVNYLEDRYKTKVLKLRIPDRKMDIFRKIFEVGTFPKITINYNYNNTLEYSESYVGYVSTLMSSNMDASVYDDFIKQESLEDDDVLEYDMRDLRDVSILLMDKERLTSGTNKIGGQISFFNYDSGSKAKLSSYIVSGFETMRHGDAKLIMSKLDNDDLVNVQMIGIGWEQLVEYLHANYGLYSSSYNVYWESGICYLLHKHISDETNPANITVPESLKTDSLEIKVFSFKDLETGYSGISDIGFKYDSKAKVITYLIQNTRYNIGLDYEFLKDSNKSFISGNTTKSGGGFKLIDGLNCEGVFDSKKIYYAKGENRIPKKIVTFKKHNVLLEGLLFDINPLTVVKINEYDGSTINQLRLAGYAREFIPSTGQVLTQLQLLEELRYDKK